MRRVMVAVLLTAATAVGAAQQWPASWRAPQQPLRIFGNVYYVGARGVSAILITSAEGHVLLDVPMQENVAMIVSSITALGFRVEDVKLILNSHAHFDHAGGIAEL
jgi:metallo-beta-lactamase class B